MAFREIAVLGLGKFGRSIATTFASNGGNVLAVDKDEEIIRDIADEVTYAVRADVTEMEVMKSLGLANVDVAVIAIADNLEASVMAVIAAKEAGVNYVICKARNEIQATVLKKVGADEIIFPERAMGSRLAKNLLQGNFVDLADLSDSFSIVEVEIPGEWVSKNLVQLHLREKYGFNIIAVRKNGEVSINVEPEAPLEAETSLVVLGENAMIAKVFRK